MAIDLTTAPDPRDVARFLTEFKDFGHYEEALTYLYEKNCWHEKNLTIAHPDFQAYDHTFDSFLYTTALYLMGVTGADEYSTNDDFRAYVNEIRTASDPNVVREIANMYTHISRLQMAVLVGDGLYEGYIFLPKLFLRNLSERDDLPFSMRMNLNILAKRNPDLQLTNRNETSKVHCVSSDPGFMFEAMHDYIEQEIGNHLMKARKYFVNRALSENVEDVMTKKGVAIALENALHRMRMG